MADARDKIQAIEEVSKTTKSKGIEPEVELERVAPNKEHFNELMQQGVIPVAGQEANKTNFMDQIRELQKKVDGVSKASPDTVLQKTHNVIAEIEEVKGKLSQPGVELNESVQNLLTNKLSHVDESLKVALNRSGVEYKAAPVAAAGSENPIERFLGFLTHGQYQLQNLASEVNQMHLNKTEISPANMLAVQIKVGYVQQEIEFFTAILNKALESTKTIMNVQV